MTRGGTPSRSTREIIVKQEDEQPVPVEVMAASIKAISDGIKKLRSGPLNDKALLLLIQHASPGYKVGYTHRKPTAVEIRAVIDGMESLEATYLKKKAKS